MEWTAAHTEAVHNKVKGSWHIVAMTFNNKTKISADASAYSLSVDQFDSALSQAESSSDRESNTNM